MYLQSSKHWAHLWFPFIQIWRDRKHLINRFFTHNLKTWIQYVDTKVVNSFKLWWCGSSYVIVPFVSIWRISLINVRLIIRRNSVCVSADKFILHLTECDFFYSIIIFRSFQRLFVKQLTRLPDIDNTYDRQRRFTKAAEHISCYKATINFHLFAVIYDLYFTSRIRWYRIQKMHHRP